MKEIISFFFKKKPFILYWSIGSDSKESACSAGDPKDPLEKGMATHPSILAWRISWAEDPDRL